MKMMLKCDNKFKEGERVGEGVREKEEDRRREAGTDGRRGGGEGGRNGEANITHMSGMQTTI